MSVQWLETPDSRDFTLDATRSEGTRRYVARAIGEADPENAVYLAVMAASPFFWNGMAKQSFKCDPLGGFLYAADVPYRMEIAGTAAQDPTQTPGPTDGPGGGSPSGTPSAPASLDDRVAANVTVEIGGRPPKLYTSLNTLQRGCHGGGVGPDTYGALLTPDHCGSVNVGKDGKVEGYEFEDPANTVTLDFTFDWCTWRYVKRLRGMVGAANNGDWWQFERREAVYLGSTIRTSQDARSTISFRLGLRAPLTIAAGDLRRDSGDGKKMPQADLTIRGWDYVWVQYEKKEDAAAKKTTTRPLYFYVEHVVKEVDFAALGIGG